MPKTRDRFRRLTAVACASLAPMLAAGSSAADDAGARNAVAVAHDAGARNADAVAHDAGARNAVAVAGDAGAHDADGGATLPPGHPTTASGDPHAGANGVFKPPSDGSVEDPTLAAGTVAVNLADADGKPLAAEEVTLAILHNTVAKGESREHVTVKTDGKGEARFTGLDVGSGVAYRAMAHRSGATFSAPPFRLTPKAGARVSLHVYPVVHDVDETLVVSQVLVYAEVKDDRVQVQESFKIYNFGRTAWVPQDMVVPLPPEFTAFTAQQGMTDVGADAIDKKGVRLRGTFAPGQHAIDFRWQLPYEGEPSVDLDIGMPPHVAMAQVIAPASRKMSLDVAGFPHSQPTQDSQQKRVLVTEKQLLRTDAPLTEIRASIRGLPTEGPGKIIATLLAAAGVALGIVLGSRKTSPSDERAERKHLLAEIEELERSHRAGDVGPKTYERARRELLEAVARTYARESA